MICNRYYKGLTNLEEEGLLRLLLILSYSKSNFHMLYIILKNESLRNKLLNQLKQLKIGVVFHYIVLYLSPMRLKLGCNKGDLPLTEDISNRIVRLPMYYELSNSKINNIIKKLRKSSNLKVKYILIKKIRLYILYRSFNIIS